MQPHNAIALESLTQLLIHNLASTSELEAFQTKHTQGQHIPKVLSYCQGRPPLLFITPWSNIAVTPSLGKFLHRPDASVELTGRAAPRPITHSHPRVTLRSTSSA
jgi:hypothetical protein